MKYGALQAMEGISMLTRQIHQIPESFPMPNDTVPFEIPIVPVR